MSDILVVTDAQDKISEIRTHKFVREHGTHNGWELLSLPCGPAYTHTDSEIRYYYGIQGTTLAYLCDRQNESQLQEKE